MNIFIDASDLYIYLNQERFLTRSWALISCWRSAAGDRLIREPTSWVAK